MRRGGPRAESSLRDRLTSRGEKDHEEQREQSSSRGHPGRSCGLAGRRERGFDGAGFHRIHRSREPVRQGWGSPAVTAVHRFPLNDRPGEAPRHGHPPRPRRQGVHLPHRPGQARGRRGAAADPHARHPSGVDRGVRRALGHREAAGGGQGQGGPLAVPLPPAVPPAAGAAEVPEAGRLRGRAAEDAQARRPRHPCARPESGQGPGLCDPGAVHLLHAAGQRRVRPPPPPLRAHDHPPPAREGEGRCGHLRLPRQVRTAAVPTDAGPERGAHRAPDAEAPGQAAVQVRRRRWGGGRRQARAPQRLHQGRHGAGLHGEGLPHLGRDADLRLRAGPGGPGGARRSLRPRRRSRSGRRSWRR